MFLRIGLSGSESAGTWRFCDFMVLAVALQMTDISNGEIRLTDFRIYVII